jgi:hypothetical protein
MRAPKGTPKGSRDMQSLRVTFHNVTSGQKAPLGRTFHNFRMRMCTPKGTPRGHVTFGTSGSHVTCTTTIVRGEKRGKRRAWAEHTSGHFKSGSLPTTWRMVTSLPVRASSGHVTDVTSGHVTFGHVTSGSSTSLHLRKCCLSCVHILLITHFVSFYDFLSGFWNCSDSVVFYFFVFPNYSNIKYCWLHLYIFNSIVDHKLNPYEIFNLCPSIVTSIVN